MRYSSAQLKGDLSGGLVAGVIALPLALAFGVQSGMGAAAGLYGAIAVGILAAAFGGTATQASGPTGPMTVVSASVVALAIEQAGTLEDGLGIILLAFLVGGVLQIILGVLGVGKYVKYFPYPVVSGFMSGVGLIIVALQLWPFLGSASPKSTLEVIARIREPLGNINGHAVVLGAITVAVYYLFPRVTKRVPSVLVALLVGTLVAVFGELQVPVIGDIPTGLPAFQLGSLLRVPPEHFPIIFEFGLTLALLGSIDSLLTSVIADNLTRTKHDSRRELIGQGIGNSVAALFGGIPGAGATKGTVVNINAGGTTRLSGMSHGLFLLAVLLGLGRFTAYIPLSVLAGLLIPVGIAIIDTKGLKHLRHVPRADAVGLLLVMVMTVFGNLIWAVGIGVMLACVLFMKKAGDLAEANTSVQTLQESPESADLGLSDTAAGSVYIKDLYGPLFFGSTAGFQASVAALPAEARVLVLRLDRVPSIDQSGVYALENAVLDLRARGVSMVLVGVHEQPLDTLQRVRLIPGLIPEDHVFESMVACAAWLGEPGRIEAMSAEGDPARRIATRIPAP